MTGAMAVQRGCGRRIKGGIYLECGMSPFGSPVEHFLCDPPARIPDGLPLAHLGINWLERGGVWHVVDWVGSSHYLNVADFVEEVRRFGLSRRIPRSAPLERLTADSRILLVHSRAILVRAAERRPHGGPGRYLCPCEHTETMLKHQIGGLRETCAGQWWEDVVGGEPLTDRSAEVVRRMSSFEYQAKRWVGPQEPAMEYLPGIFASFPAHRLVVVRDGANGHAMARAKAQQANIPVEEVDE